MYRIEFTTDAAKQTSKLQKSSPQAYKKLKAILAELREHPYCGTGHPEQLRHMNDIWSRKLDKKNRVCYIVKEDIVLVFVISVLGHYNDK